MLIDTRAQPPLIGHLVMMVYLSTMCLVGYGIANNETVSNSIFCVQLADKSIRRLKNFLDSEI